MRDCDRLKCKNDITSVIINNFNKKELINKLIDVFFKKRNANFIYSMNVYSIFESRRIREKRERKFAVFHVMFRV